MTIVFSTSQAEPHLGFYVWGGGGGGEEGANSAHPSQGSHLYRQGLNWTFCFDSYTESCLQDLLRKKKKTRTDAFCLTCQIRKINYYFHKKTRAGFLPRKIFQNNYLEFILKECFSVN